MHWEFGLINFEGKMLFMKNKVLLGALGLSTLLIARYSFTKTTKILINKKGTLFINVSLTMS